MERFSPTAATADRHIMEGHWNAPPVFEGDDSEAAKDQCLRRLEMVKLDGTHARLPAPSPEKLARHIKVYGPEGVEETMRAYGATSHEDARSLKEQGFTVSEIATRLKLSEKTVRARLALSA